MPKRILQGVAVRDARDKTVIVRVERRVMHPVYKKFIMRSKKYAAHDEHNLVKAGTVIRIEESRPISKRKRWVVLASAETPVAAEKASPAAAEKQPTAKKPRAARTRKKATEAAGAEG